MRNFTVATLFALTTFLDARMKFLSLMCVMEILRLCIWLFLTLLRVYFSNSFQKVVSNLTIFTPNCFVDLPADFGILTPF